MGERIVLKLKRPTTETNPIPKNKCIFSFQNKVNEILHVGNICRANFTHLEVYTNVGDFHATLMAIFFSIQL